MNDKQMIDDVLMKELGLVRRDLITPQARVREDLCADSMDLLCVAVALEKQFQMPDIEDQLPAIITVQDVYDVVVKYKGNSK